MKKAYVIASNQDKKEAREAMIKIGSKGYSVHDWTILNKHLTLKDKTEKDFEEFLKSDIVIVINPWRLTPGKYIEIGACRGLKKNTYFLGTWAFGVLGEFGKKINTLDEIGNV
jgi:hypothetical protein